METMKMYGIDNHLVCLNKCIQASELGISKIIHSKPCTKIWLTVGCMEFKKET